LKQVQKQNRKITKQRERRRGVVIAKKYIDPFHFFVEEKH